MQRRPPATDWKSILMIVLSALSILVLFAGSILLIFSGLIPLLILPFKETDAASAASSILLGIGAGSGGLLVIPTLYYNWRRLNGQPALEAAVKPIRFWQALILLFVALGCILLGNLILTNINWTAIFAFVFCLPGVLLPIATIIWIAVGGLDMGSRRRAWSIFTLGMTLGPVLIMVIEVILVVFALILGIIYIAFQPDLMDELTRLSERLANTTDPQLIFDLLLPHLTNPFLLLTGLAFIAILVPLMEEFLKPAGLWFLGGKTLPAQEGFTLGILSGAAFAVFESLANGSNISEGWGIVVFARIGTDLVHILGTGLMGWAMAVTWQDKKYLRLLGIYLLVALNHGIWNAQAILVGVSGLAEFIPNSLASITWVSTASIIGLSMQVIIMAGVLIGMNRRLLPKVEAIL